MRKIIVLSFITLDGVMQAPGGAGEDESNGFNLGGWTVPFFDEELGKIMGKQMGQRFDMLLGKKTYDIMAAYWPSHEEEGAALNKARKYVVSHSSFESEWNNTIQLERNVVTAIQELKKQEGPDLQVHGSGNLIQTLLKHDLIDEFWLKIFPVTLGNGKRLFADGTIPANFKLLEAKPVPSGVIIASYKRAGELRTGTF